MSDFFRIPCQPALVSLGMTSLAWMSHKAEDTSNDVLLMQVKAEVETRSNFAQDTFRLEYIRLHGKEARDEIVNKRDLNKLWRSIR